MFFIVPFVIAVGCIMAAVTINSLAFAWLAVFFAVLSIAFLLLELDAQFTEERRWKQIKTEEAALNHDVEVLRNWLAKQEKTHG